MNGQPGIDVGAGAGAGIVGLLCFLFFAAIGIAGTIFWLWMLIDCLSNEPSGNEKILWARDLADQRARRSAVLLHPPTAARARRLNTGPIIPTSGSTRMVRLCRRANAAAK